MGRKRQRDDDGEGGGGGGGRERGGSGEEPPTAQKPRRGEKTIGEQTSHIKNKQRRGAIYEKLKHKAAVRGIASSGACAALCVQRARGRCTRAAWRRRDQPARRVRRRLGPGALSAASHAALTASLRRLRGVQVAKKKARVKKQQEAARAYEAGLEPPPRAVPKARPACAARAPTLPRSCVRARCRPSRTRARRMRR